MSAVGNYLQELTVRMGDGWNRFWFSAADPSVVSLLRPLTGAMALWLLLGFTGDLTTWFAADGMLPIGMVQQLTNEEGWNGRWSYLTFFDDPTTLNIAHAAAMIVVGAFTVGFATRITSILSLIIVLSYVHRGPLLTGQFEPILTALLFYLCFAPCQRRFSVDRWLHNRKQSVAVGAADWDRPSQAANITQRMIQVHVAGLYLMMGLTKLGGSEVWWAGEAMWWLIAHPESPIVDLTSLHRYEFTINLWTHLVVAFEIGFAILVWKRLLRPLLLAIAVLHWLTLAPVTGLLSYAAIMIVASLSFLPPDAFTTAREKQPAVAH